MERFDTRNAGTKRMNAMMKKFKEINGYEPLTIIHEFGAEGHRRYLKGQKPGKWKRFETAETKGKINDEKTNR